MTRLLLPALKAAAPARVVVLSSRGHRFSDIHFDDIQYQHRPYDKWEAYGQSKTANALFTVGLTRHFGSQGIMANAVNPGAIRTGLQQHLSPEDLRAMGWTDEQGHWLNPQLWKSPEQGAATSVWAAVGQELEGVGGRHLEDCQQALPTNAKPVTSWDNQQEEAFYDIAKGVKKVVEDFEKWKRQQQTRWKRQQQPRMLSLFGYETNGGPQSALWENPLNAELDIEKFQKGVAQRGISGKKN